MYICWSIETIATLSNSTVMILVQNTENKDIRFVAAHKICETNVSHPKYMPNQIEVDCVFFCFVLFWLMLSFDINSSSSLLLHISYEMARMTLYLCLFGSNPWHKQINKHTNTLANTDMYTYDVYIYFEPFENFIILYGRNSFPWNQRKCKSTSR